jgi:hypothetical protein
VKGVYRWLGHKAGRIRIEYPEQVSAPVMVVREADGLYQDYRAVMKTGALVGMKLTDDEMEWLLGFDDDVAGHDAAYEALRDDPRRV